MDAHVFMEIQKGRFGGDKVHSIDAGRSTTRYTDTSESSDLKEQNRDGLYKFIRLKSQVV